MVNYFKLACLSFLFISVSAQSATIQDMFTAIRAEKISQVKKLTKQLGVDAADENGKTALMAAAEAPLRGWFFLSGSKNRKIVKYLLTAKAQVNQKDADGRTALHYHVNKYNLYKYDQNKLDLFLNAGAAADESDNYGNSPLLLLAKIALPHNANGPFHKEIAAKLLQRGADVNRMNMNGETPLLMASANAQLDLVKLFLSKGADAKILDMNGLTLPARVAHDYNVQASEIKQIICLLIKAGADGGDLAQLCK